MQSARERAELRARIDEPLEQLHHELVLALQIARGPDPEEAIPVLRGLYSDLGELLISLSSK